MTDWSSECTWFYCVACQEGMANTVSHSLRCVASDGSVFFSFGCSEIIHPVKITGILPLPEALFLGIPSYDTPLSS